MIYYVVVDLEMCKVNSVYLDVYNHKQEIIQIGAALMDEKLEIVKTFNEYVKPKYGDLDRFIKNLTGINPENLAGAEEIETVFHHFLEWLPEGEVIAISWSMTDRNQFIKEFEAKKIPVGERFQDILDGWVDCQPQFAQKMNMGSRQYSLEEALIATDIITEGRAHDGLADAYNTALLYAKMQREEKLVLNPYYKRAHEPEKDKTLTFSMADLLDRAMNGEETPKSSKSSKKSKKKKH